ncbi:MAG TPA: PKD domain-containing protein [Vicinamibacteria bacterium]|nr:PKD domain-containing protein [Vicinamibacteria bacterium]
MRTRLAVHVLALLFLSSFTVAPSGAGDQERTRKPRLELRASPRMAFSPVMVLATAELRGEGGEEFYCPALEWDWDDGAKSGQESDCPPFEPGMELERRFTAEHAYRRAGVYQVTVRLKRASRALAVASTTIHVRSGLGDPGEPD